MKNPSPYARKLLYTLLIILVLIVGVHLVMQYLNLQVYYEKNGFIFELSNRLDLDDEISVPTWFSGMLFVAVGAGALISAYLERVKVKRRLWGVIGVIGILMSLDEMSSTHEFFLQSLHNVFYLNTLPQASRNAWWLVAPLIVLTALGLAWQIARLLPKRTFVLFVVGGSVLLGGAVIIDVWASVSSASLFVRQGILVAIEEGCELLGASIVLYAIVDHIERVHGAAIARAKRLLKPAKT